MSAKNAKLIVQLEKSVLRAFRAHAAEMRRQCIDHQGMTPEQIADHLARQATFVAENTLYQTLESLLNKGRLAYAPVIDQWFDSKHTQPETPYLATREALLRRIDNCSTELAIAQTQLQEIHKDLEEMGYQEPD